MADIPTTPTQVAAPGFAAGSPGGLTLKDVEAQANAGLISQANFKLFERQTKMVERDVKPLVIQAYIMDQLLTPTPVSWYEMVREWHQEKAMGRAELSMSMLGKAVDTFELQKFSTPLPGFTKSFGYSWREMGVAESTGRPFDALTQRRAIKELLKDANDLGINGELTQGIKGLLAEVPAQTTVSAIAAWSDTVNAKPFEDIVSAIALVRAQEFSIQQFNVAMHPTDVGRAWKIRTQTGLSDMDLIVNKLGSVKIIETTAVPQGTVLGVPADPTMADLLTTGLPVVVPIKVDSMGVQYQIRMIAIPRVIQPKSLFKITGV